MLRLWEQAGDSGKCTIILPEGFAFARAVPVNLRGQKAGNAVPIRNNSFDIEIEAYKPVTFIFEK
jgi:hypothetical protein